MMKEEKILSEFRKSHDLTTPILAYGTNSIRYYIAKDMQDKEIFIEYHVKEELITSNI